MAENLPSRTVVVSSAGSQPALLNALMTPALVRNIQGSTSFIRGNQVSSLLAGGTYYVGALPPVTRLQWILSRSPLLLAAMIIALAFLGVELPFDTVTVALDRFGDRKHDELTNFWRQVFR